MGVIGNQALPFNPLATSGKPRDAQRFNGNGSTTIFTLTHPVTNPTDLEVFVENVQQEPLTAFDATGTQLIFTEAPPSGTNNVYVIYRNIEPGIYASIPDGAITFNKLANNIRLFTTDNFTGDNTTVTFGLSSVVPDANTLIVAVDGVFQRAPIHYTASGNTITFASAPPATSNVHVRHLGFRTTQSITALPANTTISQPILQNLVATGASTFPAGSAGAPSITTSGDTNTGIFFPAADTIGFAEGGVESARIDDSGRLLIGTTTATNNLRLAEKLAIVHAGADYPGMVITGYTGTNGGIRPLFEMQRSRGTTDGSFTKVENTDTIGSFIFRGADGSAFRDAAEMTVIVSGATGASDMPGTFLFNTSADGSASPAERVRINEFGLGVGGAIPSSGRGITFPASQSASTDPNTLDDYEEGTWTPNQGSGLSFSGGFSSSGLYTKIGNLVTVNFKVQGTNISCSSGGQITSNLPFAIPATPGNAMGSCMNSSNVNTGAYGFSTEIYTGTVALPGAGAIFVTITYPIS